MQSLGTLLTATATVAAIAAATVSVVAPLGAQTVPAHAEVIPSTRLRAIADSLPPAASRTAQLGKGGGYTYALTQRDSSGGAESHRDWTDVFVIQRGTATLLTGGTLESATEATPGERRASSIRGGTRKAVGPGDVVVIPAGVPHQMLLERGRRVAYLAFKIAAPPQH